MKVEPLSFTNRLQDMLLPFVSSLEKGGGEMARMDVCDNFLVVGKCNDWIISRFKKNDYIAVQDYSGATDEEITDEICSECPHFKVKRRPLLSREQ